MPLIEIETLIHAPQEICFDLARNVDVFISAADHAKMRAVAGVTSGMVGLNDTVTWEVTDFGIRQRLSSRVTAFDRPHRFVDETEKGAFKYWRHEHLFEAKQKGTLMIDRVTFASPFGLFGKIADALFVKSYMRRFLIKHNAHIKKLAETERA